MKYSEILTPTRFRASTTDALSTSDKGSLLQAVESDRARVVYSPAFRRLQGKTQVFPLDDNAAIRTRLTHTLEVAHVGKFLANSVLEQFDRENLSEKLGLEKEHRSAFVTLVETACLLHDIGNPPFGHFGEQAIARWFTNFSENNTSGYCRHDLLDLVRFDGNPQGFRIATRLSGADPSTGLNLTVTQLACMLKYIGLPKDVHSVKGLKKPGAFSTEEEVFAEVCAAYNIKPGGKFPLAYLMETADDISYCLSDIEDGVEKGLLSHDEAIKGIVKECSGCEEAKEIVVEASSRAEEEEKVVPTHIGFRSRIIRQLVEHAATTYVEKHEKVWAGELQELIGADDPCGQVLKGVKSFARSRIYADKLPQMMELSGLAVIAGLLDRFRPLLEMKGMDFQSLVKGGEIRKTRQIEGRLLSTIAERHLDVYIKFSDGADDGHEKTLRAHLIVDFVSGMTDRFALETYQRLSGIRL